MFSHLIKLMWNKRRANGMIFLEILLAFVVLFGVYAFMAYNLDRYQSPLGFTYDDMIGVAFDLDDELDSLAVIASQTQLRKELLAIPAVEDVTLVGPVNPFGGSTWTTGTTVNGVNIRTQKMFVGENFGRTAEVDMLEGRWFTAEDYQAKYPPIVINKEFKERYYPNVESVIDSVWNIDGEHVVVGMTNDFKYKSNFAENFPLTFFPQMDIYEDNGPFEQLMIRLEPGSLAAQEERIYKLIANHTKNPDVVIWDMAKDRRKANRPITIPLTILLVIAGFLLINIALGLFGVLFTQIARRRAEIGLRKALGASPGEVTRQFVGEILVVTVAGLLLGFFFAIQVPLLELTPIPAKFFYFGIAGAIITILVIVVLCALLPSRQASLLQPASVLHEQ